VPRVPRVRRRRVSHIARLAGGSPACPRRRPCCSPCGASLPCAVFPLSACSFFFLSEGLRVALCLLLVALLVCGLLALLWSPLSLSGRPPLDSDQPHRQRQRRRSRAVAGLGAAYRKNCRRVVVWLSATAGRGWRSPPFPHRLDTTQGLASRGSASTRHARPSLCSLQHTPLHGRAPVTGRRPRLLSHGSSAVPPSGARRRPRVWSPIAQGRRRRDPIRCDTPVSGHTDQLGSAPSRAPGGGGRVRSCTLLPPPARGPRWMATATLRAPRIVLVCVSPRASGGVCAWAAAVSPWQPRPPPPFGRGPRRGGAPRAGARL